MKSGAMARSISAEMHAGFTSVRSAMPMNVRRSILGRARTPEVDKDIARIQAIWGAARTGFGQGGPFLFGAFTIADAFFAPVVGRFVTYGVELDAACQAYADAVGRGTVVAVALADPDMLGTAPNESVGPMMMRAAGADMGAGPTLELRPDDVVIAAAVDARFTASD